jgi:putative effector of murein hydrolase LrgA (UPF0299 family)
MTLSSRLTGMGNFLQLFLHASECAGWGENGGFMLLLFIGFFMMGIGVGVRLGNHISTKKAIPISTSYITIGFILLVMWYAVYRM